MNEKQHSFVAGSLIAAVLASVCCIGPLLAAMAGLGAFGAVTMFEAARPYFLALTTLLLGAAFYLTYRRKDTACADGVCSPAVSRRSRAALWIALAVVVALTSFPYYSGRLWKLTSPESTIMAASVDASSASIVIPIEGLTCSGCAGILETKLSELPGVHRVRVSFEQKTAAVQFDQSQLKESQIRDSIRTAGFQTSR